MQQVYSEDDEEPGQDQPKAFTRFKSDDEDERLLSRMLALPARIASSEKDEESLRQRAKAIDESLDLRVAELAAAGVTGANAEERKAAALIIRANDPEYNVRSLALRKIEEAKAQATIATELLRREFLALRTVIEYRTARVSIERNGGRSNG